VQGRTAKQYHRRELLLTLAADFPSSPELVGGALIARIYKAFGFAHDQIPILARTDKALAVSVSQILQFHS
jgi:hypothetical protein